jgi:hypothetical protein
MLVVFPMPGMPCPRGVRDIQTMYNISHRDDDMRAVSVTGDDFQSLNGLAVADNIFQHFGPELFDPWVGMRNELIIQDALNYQGSS